MVLNGVFRLRETVGVPDTRSSPAMPRGCRPAIVEISKQEDSKTMKRVPSRPKTAHWIERSTRFSAKGAEQARAEMAHPSMLALQSALRLLSQVAQDRDWLQANDPRGRLDGAIEALVGLTTVRATSPTEGMARGHA